MKVTNEDRKIVAVVGTLGMGLFVPSADGRTVFIDSMGIARVEPKTLRQVLAKSSDRCPVYEGDKITIQF